MNSLLEVRGLTAGAAGKQILNGVDMQINKGETHVLLGPNGAGKSTLGNVLMGNPAYEITGGDIVLDGENITSMTADKRSKAGLFMSFQNAVEITGITLGAFLRAAATQRSDKPLKIFAFKKKLEEQMKLLEMDPSYAERDLNVSFSGGEKKKSEILQLLMLEPKLAILDETDSGLDVDAVRIVGKGIDVYQKQHDGALLIITHSTRLLEGLHIDRTYVLVKGKIVATGDASLVTEIDTYGFEKYEKAEAGEHR